MCRSLIFGNDWNFKEKFDGGYEAPPPPAEPRSEDKRASTPRGSGGGGGGSYNFSLDSDGQHPHPSSSTGRVEQGWNGRAGWKRTAGCSGTVEWNGERGEAGKWGDRHYYCYFLWPSLSSLMFCPIQLPTTLVVANRLLTLLWRHHRRLSVPSVVNSYTGKWRGNYFSGWNFPWHISIRAFIP
jgi:hypothetical protein